MLTYEDKFPLTDKINALRQDTKSVSERMDYHRSDDESRQRDTIQAICTLTNAVLMLAEIQLEVGVQP